MECPALGSSSPLEVGKDTKTKHTTTNDNSNNTTTTTTTNDNNNNNNIKLTQLAHACREAAGKAAAETSFVER